MIALSEPIRSTDDMIERSAKYENGIGEVFQYLKDHVDEFEEGDIQPEDLPNVDEGSGSVIMASVMFGLLWEREYPTDDPVEIRHRLSHDIALAAKNGIADDLDEDELCEMVKERLREFDQNSSTGEK